MVRNIDWLLVVLVLSIPAISGIFYLCGKPEISVLFFIVVSASSFLVFWVTGNLTIRRGGR